MSRKSWRKIVVDGVEYKWIYGKTTVVIRDADNAVVDKVLLTKLTGWSWADIERAQYKRYFKITPVQIADWIQEHVHA